MGLKRLALRLLLIFLCNECNVDDFSFIKLLGMKHSPQLHARSLMIKSPDAGAGAASADDRLDVLIKNLTKESLATNQLQLITGSAGGEDSVHEKVHNVNSVAGTNTVVISVIPNNQTVKSVNQGSAKPLPPDQLKCNILKARKDDEERKATTSTAKVPLTVNLEHTGGIGNNATTSSSHKMVNG
jgi:hypothetical protein